MEICGMSKFTHLKVLSLTLQASRVLTDLPTFQKLDGGKFSRNTLATQKHTRVQN